MTYILNERNNNMRYTIKQRTNKYGPVERYDVFDEESYYYNTTALATFSLHKHAKLFITVMNNE